MSRRAESAAHVTSRDICIHAVNKPDRPYFFFRETYEGIIAVNYLGFSQFCTYEATRLKSDEP